MICLHVQLHPQEGPEEGFPDRGCEWSKALDGSEAGEAWRVCGLKDTRGQYFRGPRQRLLPSPPATSAQALYVPVPIILFRTDGFVSFFKEN